MPGSLIVGYDGTDGARAALDHALGLAGQLGAEVVAVFSYEVPRWGGETKDLDEAIAERGAAVLEHATHQAAAAGGKVSTELRAVDPASGLLAAAAEHGAAYIVVGSYGERPLKSLLVGSTPTKLLHLSEVPVIVVPIAE